jgi:hypothetical protein
MTICAVCQLSDGLVINLIAAETTDPCPVEGCVLIEVPFCDIGYIWDGQRFNPPLGNNGK